MQKASGAGGGGGDGGDRGRDLVSWNDPKPSVRPGLTDTFSGFTGYGI